MLKAIDSPFSKWSKTATFWLSSLLLTQAESRATFILWSPLGNLIAVSANSIESEIYKNKACLLFLLLERENRVRISLVFRITGYSLVLQVLNQFFFYYTYSFSMHITSTQFFLSAFGVMLLPSFQTTHFCIMFLCYPGFCAFRASSSVYTDSKQQNTLDFPQ